MTFVCEKYFEGAIDEIKEYSIAVHALGRPEYLLIRRWIPLSASLLTHCERGSKITIEAQGQNIRSRFVSPPGHYVPKFIHTRELEAAKGRTKGRRESEQPNSRQATLGGRRFARR